MNRKARIGAAKASRVPWTICRGARQVCFTETIYPLRTTQKAACCLVNADVTREVSTGGSYCDIAT
jgi:hypothetical protein